MEAVRMGRGGEGEGLVREGWGWPVRLGVREGDK